MEVGSGKVGVSGRRWNLFKWNNSALVKQFSGVATPFPFISQVKNGTIVKWVVASRLHQGALIDLRTDPTSFRLDSSIGQVPLPFVIHDTRFDPGHTRSSLESEEATIKCVFRCRV